MQTKNRLPCILAADNPGASRGYLKNMARELGAASMSKNGYFGSIIVDAGIVPQEHPQLIVHGIEGDEPIIESDNGPAALYVWKTTADPFVGRMTYFKVLSGTVSADAHFWNQSKSADERMGGLHIQRGKEQLPVKFVHAGDLAVVSKLSITATGDTLCDKNHPLLNDPPVFPAALYQVAVHPKAQADTAKITPTLTRLCEEDMTLSWHNEPPTGQPILQGMGDQHIDVAIHSFLDSEDRH